MLELLSTSFFLSGVHQEGSSPYAHDLMSMGHGLAGFGYLFSFPVNLGK